MPMDTDLVVRQAVTVPLSQAEAFRLFTEDMAAWWPAVTHSVAQSDRVEARMDGRVGGRIIEWSPAGEVLWGTITEWDPPAGFSSTWHPGDEATLATTLTVRFHPEGERQTRVELEHRGWQVYGVEAATRAEGYDTGWAKVLGRYVERAGR